MAQGHADTRTRQDWEDLGRIDPEWAILSEPGKQHGGWDSDEFFASGRAEVDRILARADTLGLLGRRGRALDVGCGIGRVSAALADHFDEVVGVDISDAMLSRARELHAARPGLRFDQAPADDLSALATDSFDLAFTKLVLQHLPSRTAILNALGEMLRVIAPGGLLIAQTTSALPLRHRLQPRPRVYRALRRAGISADLLYARLRLQPMRMTVVPTRAATALLRERGAHLHDVVTEAKEGGVVWTTYWVTV